MRFAYAERVHSPLRVLQPPRRTGPKGAGVLARITWREAIDEIAARGRALVAADGAEAILAFSYAGSCARSTSTAPTRPPSARSRRGSCRDWPGPISSPSSTSRC